MTRLSIRFDLRVPAFAKTTFASQHRAMLEMVSWADRLRFDAVCLSEHHGDPSGFTSAPLTLAAAVLARTERIHVSVAAALVPLHDPVRLAEQITTIDCLAPGRLEVVVGAGYRSAEFAMAGVERRERGARVEECVAVLRGAFSGRPFAFRGREVLATPPPATPGGPAIFVGGKTVASARRAARLRCGYSPAVAKHEVVAAYFEEAVAIGFAEADVFGCRSFDAYRARHPANAPAAPGFVMVTRDPDATWREIGPLAVHDAVTYAAWQEDGVVSDTAVPGAATWQDLRASGQFAVVTPEECLALAARDGSLMLHPLMGGIEPALAWEGLRLFEREVLPRLSRGA
ncbi:MAG: LLM class flavin-dependent oxidoreductase [Myxococcota bacterium]